jgi:hypothetical protein
MYLLYVIDAGSLGDDRSARERERRRRRSHEAEREFVRVAGREGCGANVHSMGIVPHRTARECGVDHTEAAPLIAFATSWRTSRR